MINEDRVKELFQVAVYDQNDDKLQEQVKTYFKSDYTGKEIIKSFFTGTIAFACIGALRLLYSSAELLEQINSLEYVQMGLNVGLTYLVFMMVYLFITLLVYTIRYNVAYKKLKNYGEHITKINKMYEREDKLK